jgi:dipeptidyl-peptidase-4
MFRPLPALLLAALAAAAQTRPVTLADVTATRPRPHSGPVAWAPDGRRFAFTHESVLFQYDVPSQTEKEIVKLEALRAKAVKSGASEPFDWQNRRVVESSHQWSPDGKTMLVAAEGDLFLVEVASGEFNQITATAEPERDPKLSPDGKRVSFRRRQDLYTLEIASRKETRLTHDGSPTLLNGQLDWVYPEELDLGTAYWWSPDAARIAYLQFDVSREPVFPQVDLLGIPARYEPMRYPKAGDPNADVRLGVVSAAGGATRWMDLGETRDALLARVDWLPNSRSIAVQRLNRIQSRLDLMLADPGTGAARLVLREQDPQWVGVTNMYRFLKDGMHFIWSSERTGFRHLYFYSVDGKLRHTLTEGDWEVTDLNGVDEGTNAVYYTSTQETPLERHLYRTNYLGRRPVRLTESAGTHTVSMSPTCEYFLDTASSAAEPTARTLHARDGKRLAVYLEPERPDRDILPAEFLTVKAADGTPLTARVIKPAGFTPGKKYPAIVMVYGGPTVQTVRNAWSGANWDQALAHQGFVIWALDNRGSGARGRKFQAPVFRNLGAVELEDQKAGVAHLVSMGFVDPARIGIYGWSYGGYMTLNALLNEPKLFKAGISGAPVTDWRFYDTIYTERYMGLPEDNPDGYRRTSLIDKAEKLAAKLLLIHNFGDDNVHFQNALQMSDALQKAGKQFEMVVYAQKAHHVSGPQRKQMLEAMTRFFVDNLR